MIGINNIEKAKSTKSIEKIPRIRIESKSKFIKLKSRG